MGSSVRRVTPPPSAFMTYMSVLPLRSDPKAIRDPSGDQAGKPSAAGSSVRRRGDDPSAFMTYISPLPSRPEAKARREPSGDQAGGRPGPRSGAGFPGLRPP